MNVLSKFFWSFQISKQTIFSCFLIAGILSIFFYGIWESIDSWKVLLAVFAFGYGSISLAIQMSRRSNLERILCEAQRKRYIWCSLLKNLYFSLSFWVGLSVLWVLFSAQVDISISDTSLFLLVNILLFASECLALLGIAPAIQRIKDK